LQEGEKFYELTLVKVKQIGKNSRVLRNKTASIKAHRADIYIVPPYIESSPPARKATDTLSTTGVAGLPKSKDLCIMSMVHDTMYSALGEICMTMIQHISSTSATTWPAYDVPTQA